MRFWLGARAEFAGTARNMSSSCANSSAVAERGSSLTPPETTLAADTRVAGWRSRDSAHGAGPAGAGRGLGAEAGPGCGAGPAGAGELSQAAVAPTSLRCGRVLDHVLAPCGASRDACRPERDWLGGLARRGGLQVPSAACRAGSAGRGGLGTLAPAPPGSQVPSSGGPELVGRGWCPERLCDLRIQ